MPPGVLSKTKKERWRARGNPARQGLHLLCVETMQGQCRLLVSNLVLLLASRWEYDESYCDAVKKTSPYDSGPRLLDIIDTAVFDYLIGNADRHHYESFQDDEGASMLILLDNAKR